jgi:hypothetical protein
MIDRRILTAVSAALLEAAIDAGDDGIVSGHAYAALCGVVPLGVFQAILTMLVRQDLLTCRSHVYRATPRLRAELAKPAQAVS